MSAPKLTPVRRAARLLRLLRERPHTLPELHEALGVSAPQLRRDLEGIAAEGWVCGGTGRPKTLRLLQEPGQE